MNNHVNFQIPVTSISKLGTLCLASCRKLVAQIESVKSRLLSEFQKKLGTNEQLLRLALNEAEAAAWDTGYPQLVFPELAFEKVQAAAHWQARQKQIQRSTMDLALVA